MDRNAGLRPAHSKPTLFPRDRGIENLCTLPFPVDDPNGLRAFAEAWTRAASKWQRERLIGQSRERLNLKGSR